MSTLKVLTSDGLVHSYEDYDDMEARVGSHEYSISMGVLTIFVGKEEPHYSIPDSTVIRTTPKVVFNAPYWKKVWVHVSDYP